MPLIQQDYTATNLAREVVCVCYEFHMNADFRALIFVAYLSAVVG